MCKRVDKDKNETVLIKTNFSKSSITTRRPIRWEEIIFPENWTITQDIQRNPVIQSDLRHVTQSNEGIVNIQFNNDRRRLLTQSNPLSRSESMRSHRSHLSPIDYIVDQQSARASTSYIREDLRE